MPNSSTSRHNGIKLKYFIMSVVLSVKVMSPASLAVNILGFGMAFLPMLIALRLQAFTDYVQALYGQRDLFFTAVTAFAILIGLFAVQSVFSFVRAYMVSQDGMRIKRHIREQMIILLTGIPFKYIETQGEFREKVTFVKQYGGGRTAGSVSRIFGWISGIISFFSVAFILWGVNPWIVVMLIATSIPSIVVSHLRNNAMYKSNQRAMKNGHFLGYYESITMRNEMVKEVRFLGIYDNIKEKWRRHGREWMMEQRSVTRRFFAINSGVDLLRNGVYLVIMVITAWSIFDDPERGLGLFMLVVSASASLQGITTSLFTDAASIFTDVKYMEDFFKLLETERINDETEDKAFGDVTIGFNDVDFAYPGSDVLALDGLNVKIRQGEKIAIVGANGSGKSTFVNLLCGLYGPKSGTAEMNGVSISENSGRVCQSMSVIFQQFCQYQDTIRNNIAISDPLRADDDEAILALAQRTGADEVIKDQADSLDEMLGIFAKDGNNLSGGQWQKIAITRALFRKDARVYILDEPTAALDPIAEANIYKNFASLTEDKTTILISHRLGVTSVVDRILVFDKGKIVEDGSHSELMAADKLYAEMYRAQAQWYQ